MKSIFKSIVSVLIASTVVVSSNAVVLANDIEDDSQATNQTAVFEAAVQSVSLEEDIEPVASESKEEMSSEPSTEKPEEKPAEAPSEKPEETLSEKPEEKPIEDSFKVTLSSAKFTYNGAVQKPTVTVKNEKGKALANKKDYTISYSNENSTNVGTYKVTVKYIGKYSGSYDCEYKIVARDGAKPALNRTVITKTGTVQRPTVTVKDDLGNNLT